MKASVIIPTYQGAHKILNVLNSLLNQTETAFEIIVVVDGSSDNTLELITPYENRIKNFRIVVQKNSGRSCTRNRGASEAQSDILIFYDDDMIPNVNSIKQHVNFHEERPGCLLGGNQMEVYSDGNSDIQNYKVQLSEKWISRYPSGASKVDIENLFFTSANCSIQKVTFNQLKGFDERLTDTEDFDLAYRAIKAGISVFFDKSNKAIHNERITCFSYVKRLRQYSTAKQKWNEIQSISNNRKLTFKHFFYLPFASLFWIKAIDKNFFKWIPARLRYKLYNIIIQATAIEFPKQD
jgi:glycosyltransferase involved in cell wall biosynthesis